MFDVGFTELLLIAVVALLVLGPEQMFSLIRHVGLWVRRFRVYSTQVKDDIDRELNLKERRKHMHQLESDVKNPINTLERQLQASVEAPSTPSPTASNNAPSSSKKTATETKP